MKLFLKELLIYFLAVTLLLYVIQYTLLGNPLFMRIISYNVSKSVYISEFLSKRKTSKKKLYLGDSVGRQLFGQGEQGNYYSLCATQAITMVGQFILLKNFCDRNSIDTVVLVYHPSSFQNNMDLKYTYSHLLKPFYHGRNKELFSPYANSIIDSIPYASFSQFPYIKMTNWNPHYKYLENLDYSKFFFSKIAIEYLIKMKKYCIEKEIVLKVISPPLRKDIFGDLTTDLFCNQLKENNFSSLFAGYIKSLQYIPSTYYVDEMHFKGPMIKEVRAIIENSLN